MIRFGLFKVVLSKVSTSKNYPSSLFVFYIGFSEKVKIVLEIAVYYGIYDSWKAGTNEHRNRNRDFDVDSPTRKEARQRL
jgi:hypothetical protein